MRIDIEDVFKAFASFAALKGVDLSIADGELVALLGPSGSGKTTLLRAIAGLERPDRGRILFNGKDIARTPVQKRNVGFVFQHYALFRHMRVWENVAFGLKVRPWSTRPGKALRRARAFELLDLVQLQGMEDRFPNQLSGGQRQRVALARALAIDPAALLLDEPFGALDAKVRRELRRWLRDLHDKTRHTTVFVTHDQEEALELADRVIVMRDGAIEQIGTPEDIFLQPATGFVYGFLGDTNALDVVVRGGTVFLDGHSRPLLKGVDRSDGPARLFIRPTEVTLDVGEDHLSRPEALPGVVTAIRRRLDSLRVEVHLLEAAGAILEVAVDRCRRGQMPTPGQSVWLTIDAHGLFSRDSRSAGEST